MVEFDDCGVLAQLSYPTMELPIQLALTYPERMDCGLQPLDFEKLAAIRFLPLERKKFPCYDLALSAAEAGDNFPCALNGAGEVAVRAFLDGRIPFPAIAETIENVLASTERMKPFLYDVLAETDAQARRAANEYINEYISKLS
jgi:1-deoxy-D-xylulose-5-phosphate reductoisomerase